MTPLALLLALLLVDEEWTLSRPDPAVHDIALSEAQAEAVANSLRQTLVRGLETFDWERVATAFTDNARGRWPRLDEGQSVEDSLFTLEQLPAPTGHPVERARLVEDLQVSLQHFVALERVRWKIYEFVLAEDQTQAYAAAHVTLAGPTGRGGRQEWHGSVEMSLRAVAEETWRIHELRFLEGYRVDSCQPPFRDVTDLVGFHFNQSPDNRALNQAFVNARAMLTVGGVSVLDWNRDGFPDVLATRRDQLTVLFQNDGQGGFERQPLPLELPRDAGHMFLHVDLDNDGYEELVSSQILGHEGPRAWAGLFTRQESGWTRIERAFPFAAEISVRGLSAQALAVADVNGDGLLDVFFGMHSDERSGQGDYNSYAAHDGARNLLFINQGELSFREEAVERGLHGRQYTFLGHFFDFDEDGDPDLLEGNDFGPNWLWENDGQGHFERRDEHPLSGESSYTMGISQADFDNSGRWAVHLSNMYSHAGNRIVPLATHLGEDLQRKVQAIGRGNQLFTREPDGHWSEGAAARGIDESGWAWASMFFDVDNDRDRDLFVTNGYTSHQDESLPDW